MIINVLCNAPEQLSIVLENVGGSSEGSASERKNAAFGEIMIEAVKFPEDEYRKIVEKCHDAGVACRLALPYIFRDRAEKWFTENKKNIAGAAFDGYLIRSLAEFSVVHEIEEFREKSNMSGAHWNEDVALIKTDYNMYAMNAQAKTAFKELGAGMLTAPVELNERELHILDISDMEMLIYGRIPMMISAQCTKKSMGECGKPGNVQIKDRRGQVSVVENVCRLCYNIIYNSVPLSMIGVREKLMRLSVPAVRLSFTTEDRALCANILKAYTDAFVTYPENRRDGKRNKGVAAGRNANLRERGDEDRPNEEPVPAYTRGHFSRGVE